MSVGRLVHKRLPATRKAQSPTVTTCHGLQILSDCFNLWKSHICMLPVAPGHMSMLNSLVVVCHVGFEAERAHCESPYDTEQP